uniref:BTB domain-containing protein n=1 Tax=Leersia perrieri TaxID=77586 RepID=A0A0D9XUD7_9ORYZ
MVYAFLLYKRYVPRSNLQLIMSADAAAGVVDDASSSTTAAAMMTTGAAAPPPSLVAAAESSSSYPNIIGKLETERYVVKFSHYAKAISSTRIGEFQTSNTFAGAGHNWQIIYYPNGCNDSARGYISVFLKLVGDISDLDDNGLRADVRFTIVAKSATEKPYTCGFRHTFVPPDRCHGIGYPWFITHERMESYIDGDSFLLQCVLAVEMPPFVVDVPPSTLGWHLGDLLGDSESADVTVVVDGENFPAHRFVLAARSLVFKAELFGPMKGEKGVIRVDDMHADVFREFLHFIYTDRLSDQFGSGDCDDGEEEAIMAQHLLVAADKFDLPRLKVICENKLCKHLDVNTAATTLVLAEQHGCHGLKKVVLMFLKVSSNMEAVKCTDGYNHLLESCPSLDEELRSQAPHS